MNKNEIILYETADREIVLEVNTDGNTVWLNRNQLAQLFDRDVSVIGRHINAVFKEKEVDKESNVQNLHIPNSDKKVEFYSLDVIISVGYRIKSQRGVEFRKWANKVLKDYIIKGYSVNHKFTTFGIAKSQMLRNCPHLSLRLTV